MYYLPDPRREMNLIQREKWHLDLQFKKSRDEQTFLLHQFSRYPFHLCRVQYLDKFPKGLGTVYLQSSAGGIFSDDRLFCRFHALPETMAHLTSQASTIVHRMDHGYAEQNVTIRAEESCLFEYLPDPLILFPKARLRSKLKIEMAPTATVMLGDAFLSHDPDSKIQPEHFSEYFNEIHVTNLSGQSICLDRNRAGEGNFFGNFEGCMGTHSAMGTFYLLNQTLPSEQICEQFRSVLDSLGQTYSGVSTLPNQSGAWARIVAPNIAEIRLGISELWRAARKMVKGSFPSIRRK